MASMPSGPRMDTNGHKSSRLEAKLDRCLVRLTPSGKGSRNARVYSCLFVFVRVHSWLNRIATADEFKGGEESSRSRSGGKAGFRGVHRAAGPEAGPASHTVTRPSRHSRECRSSRNPPIAANLSGPPDHFVRVRPS